MNICYLYDYFGEGGGSEEYGVYLAEEATRSGHRAEILFSSGTIKKNHSFGVRHFPLGNYFSIPTAQRLKKYFIENKMDIVHVAYPKEEFLALMARTFGAKVRIVRTYHRLDRFGFKAWLLENIFSAGVSGYVATSELVQTKMVKFGIPQKKITLILNGSPAVPTKTHAKAVGFLGRLSAEKGILELVDNWPASGPNLVVAGVGPELKSIESLIRAKGFNNIELMGLVEDRVKFFEKISVLALPSKTEALPLVIPESFSCGVPVVAFEIPGMQVVLGMGGMVVAGGDFAAMNTTLAHILTDGAAMSKAARTLYEEKYSVKVMWSKTEALYKRIAG